MIDKRWDVLGFGAIAVDDLIYVDRYPQLDEKVPIVRIQRQGGGNTATALVAVARQGSKAAYCGVLGRDALSIYSIQELAQEGIDTSTIFIKEDAKPFAAYVIVDTTNGKRSIAYSSEGVTQPDPKDVPEDLIKAARVLFIDHKAPSIGMHVARLAHKNHLPVVGDFEGVIDAPLRTLIDLVDHLIIGIDFARDLTGKDKVEEMLEVLASPERACCVITNGDQGCWYSISGKTLQHFPAFKIKVEDTTGCGDVFHGAYAAAIARGENIDQAIQFASAAAGIKATRPGGRAGIPDLAAIRAFLEKHSEVRSITIQ
jgi:sulfofructose kinase